MIENLETCQVFVMPEPAPRQRQADRSISSRVQSRRWARRTASITDAAVPTRPWDLRGGLRLGARRVAPHGLLSSKAGSPDIDTTRSASSGALATPYGSTAQWLQSGSRYRARGVSARTPLQMEGYLASRLGGFMPRRTSRIPS
jgi:hypothetical protein